MRITKRLLILAIVGILTACTVCPPCPPCETPVPTPVPTVTPAPEIRVDPRIDNFMGLGPLNVKLGECGPDCRYRVKDLFVTVDGIFDGAPQWAWDDYVLIDGAGGATHMFAVAYRYNGSPLKGKTVVHSWPAGSGSGVTGADGAVNFYGNAVYFPDKGVTGPYCIQPLKGQEVCGGGLPYGNHVSLWVGYEELWPDTPLDVIKGLLNLRR